MRRSLIAVVFLATACGTHLAYMPTNTAPKVMQPRPASEVEVFTASKPSREFVEVGMIEGQQQYYSLDMETEVFAKLRQEAADRGCDGLIVSGANDSVVGEVHGGGAEAKGAVWGNTRTLRGYRGACIVYKVASAEPPRKPREAPEPPRKSRAKSRR